MMRKFLLFPLFLLLPSAVFTFAQKDSQKTQSPQKTTEQVFKNIQSLKGDPADQLIPTMEYFSASLGVECGFCHVDKPVFAPEKDDKDEKKAARLMIAMTRSINKANFEDRPAVGCTTCHRGNSNPVAVPPVGDERQAAKATREQQPKTPTPEQVLQNYYAAEGGKAALEKLTTRVTKGSLSLPQGKMAFEIDQKVPNLYFVSLTLPNGTTFTQGFNGSVAWHKGGGPAEELNGPELALAAAVARFFYPELSYPPNSINDWVAIEQVNGHDCYVLRPKAPADSNVFERLYFEKQSGLLLRRTLTERTLFGPLPNNWVFSDYRDVNGVKVPFSVARGRWDGSVTFTVESVQFNVPLEDSKFQKPSGSMSPTPPGAAR